MANEIRVGLNVTGEQQAKRALKTTGEAAEKAGDQLHDMGEDAGYLSKQAIEASAALKALTRELDRTGDEGLKKDINKERRRLREAERLLKDLVPEVTPVASKAGVSFGETFTTNAAKAITSGNPYVTGAVLGVALSSAPLVGGAIGAAVLGGVGVGGIVGGIALAAQDPQVQSAAKQVGQTIMGELGDAAEPFIDPVLRSLGKLENAGIGAKLAPALAELSKSVDPLTDGVLDLVDNLVPGLTAAARGAGPVLHTLGEELGDVGAAASRMLTLIASDPEGAQDALRALTGSLEVGLQLTGYFVAGLTQVYGKIVDIGQALHWIDEYDMEIIPRGSTQQVNEFGKSVEEAAEEAQALNTALNALFGHTLGAKEATLAYEQAVDDLREELTDGKRTLDENTQAGRDNWEAINNQARAINDLREANVRNNMPLSQANALYEKQFEQLRKTLLNLGYNKTAVNEYIDRLKNIPKSVSTTVFLDVFTNNASLLALAGAKAVSGKRAAGGPVLSGRSYIVGENGPEIVEMDGNGYVHNASQTKAMMSGGPGASAVAMGGAAGIQIIVSAAPGPLQQFVEFMLPHIQIAVAGQGGVVQDVLGVPQR